jgi:dihydroorotase
MAAFLFRNARIIDPSQDLDFEGEMVVQGGVIAAMGRDCEPPAGAITVDFGGRWIVPGLIDLHVHLREPGEEYKETIASGSAAAAAGGFTAVACMPNTRPVNDNSGITRFILARAQEAAMARVYPVAAITMGQEGEQLSEFGDLLKAGAMAFSDDGRPVTDAGMMRLALEYARNFGALIISHSEELGLSQGGSINEGRVSTVLGLKGIPNAAEEIAVFRDVKLAELTGGRLHIAHVSTKGSVDIIRNAKARGIRVTAETAPHYFTLTEEAALGYNTLAKMNPPLRTGDDRTAIIEGLRDGTIDVIATDHAPHSTLEKDREFELAANGIIGLETALPLSLELVRQGHLTPAEMIRCMSANPARILGVPGGTLKAGTQADLSVIDPEAGFTVTADALISLSRNTPFLGETLRGRAAFTMVGGHPVFDPEGLLAG